MNIEIITTPNNALKETGFGSLTACQSVCDAISKLGHDVIVNVCETLHDLDLIVQRKPDLVVLAVKYISIENGSNIWLSEYLSTHDINFTGSSREVLKFDSDKVLAKIHLRSKGMKTANYFTAIPGQYRSEANLPIAFPLFLKPLDAANGNGIDDLSLVTNFEEFESKTLALYDAFQQPVLAEEYLEGREYSVAVIKSADGKLLVAPVEIIPPESSNGMRILGEQAKRDDSEQIMRIADQHVIIKVKQLAIEAFLGLGIRDFGRIDIKTNKCGDCYFMEANLVPGMTAGSSYFPQACNIEQALSYREVIQRIIEAGISRVPMDMPLAIPELIDADAITAI